MAGLYLHVPFCAHRCGYCDFAVTVGAGAGERARYAELLADRIERLAAAGPAAVAPDGAPAGEAWPAFASVFVGGGTPTLLEPGDLAGVLARARAALPVDVDAEVTVEANPETLVEADGAPAPQRLAPLVEAGLTRVSIGAQSTSTAVLEALDRRHDPQAVPAAVAAARAAGAAQVAVDLIAGAPGETDAQWRASLDDVLACGVDHVSCYALTLEANTPYARRVASGRAAPPDDAAAADRIAAADAALADAGLERYEVSNWARPGARCRHNLGIWRGGDYLAAGAGAHGHWAGRRWWEVRATSAWLRAAEGRLRRDIPAGPPAPHGPDDAMVGGGEVVDAARRRAERLLAGLRTVEGVGRDEVAPVDEAAAAQLADAGLLDDDGERLRPTPAGLDKVDGMALALLP